MCEHIYTHTRGCSCVCLYICVQLLSRVQLFATPWPVAHQALLSIDFSRREYYSGLPFASSGDLPDPVIEPWSPTLLADSLLSEPPEKPMFIYRCTHLKAFEVHAKYTYMYSKYVCEYYIQCK